MDTSLITKEIVEGMSQITQGEWVQTKYGPSELIARVYGKNIQQRMATTELITEAINTSIESGLSPAQLLEQNKTLAEALTEIATNHKKMLFHTAAQIAQEALDSCRTPKTREADEQKE